MCVCVIPLPPTQIYESDGGWVCSFKPVATTPKTHTQSVVVIEGAREAAPIIIVAPRSLFFLSFSVWAYVLLIEAQVVDAKPRSQNSGAECEIIMGAKQSSDKSIGSAVDTNGSGSTFAWGEAPDTTPADEKDPNDMVLQAWAFCKAKPSPVKHYRSDVEERARRVALQWRKRASFIELDCGEDSFFVSNTYRTLGVADGVGGWRDEGVDPALFSNKLMESAKLFTETHRKEFDPEKIMQHAFDKVVHDKKVRAGSSTCCIASLVQQDGKWWMEAANLGDSGMLVVRNREIHHRMHEKIHAFNSPYQLAVLPDHLKGRAYADRVADSVRERVEVQQGDVVVLGTDGLFDNRFNTQIAMDAGWVGTVQDSVLERIPLVGFLLAAVFSAGDQKIEYVDPYRIAQRVVQDAYKNSVSKEADTPWALMLQEFGVKDAKGGKVDDITMVLARVSTREELGQGLVW